MLKPPTIVAIVAVLFVGQKTPVRPPVPDAALQKLYEGHRWFELREAMADRSTPALYAGAVAAAFNHVGDAEKYLTRAVREAATLDAANDAREHLLNVYMRLSRTADALPLLDAGLAAVSTRNDFENVRALFEGFRRLPNLTSRPGETGTFRCTVKDDGVRLPATVNGHNVEWLLDTAFSTTSMSESEARALGVSVHGASGRAGDFAGGTTRIRAGLAGQVNIGQTQLRNVPVLVFADTQPPWNELPAGRKGAFGIPIAIALGGIAWTRDGTCKAGARIDAGREPEANLAFDGMTLIARARIAAGFVDFVLDSGNQGSTQLWDRFASDFPQLVAGGTKTTRQVTQIGGTTTQTVTRLPELRLHIGGFDALLRPVDLFATPVGDDVHHGNVGMDVLRQSAEVIIDFHAMSLVIR